MVTHLYPHECDDCRGRQVFDDYAFIKQWKVVQVTAADYWTVGIKSSARVLNQHIASLGVLHFNDRMYCPAHIVDKDIRSLLDRARQTPSRPDGIVMVDGLAVPVPLPVVPNHHEPSRQQQPRLGLGHMKDCDQKSVAVLTVEKMLSVMFPTAPHRHSWLFWEAHPSFDWSLPINPLLCACGAFAIYKFLGTERGSITDIVEAPTEN
jgi:hypothetical protein